MRWCAARDNQELKTWPVEPSPTQALWGSLRGPARMFSTLDVWNKPKPRALGQLLMECNATPRVASRLAAAGRETTTLAVDDVLADAWFVAEHLDPRVVPQKQRNNKTGV